MPINKTKKQKNNKTKRNKKPKTERKKSGGSNFLEQNQQNQINTITRRMINFMSPFVRPFMNLKSVVRNGDAPINTP